MSNSKRHRLTGALVAATLLSATAACSSSKSSTPSGGSGGAAAGAGDAPFAVPAAKTPTCDATPVGPITRCANFYTDYWPNIEANLQSLYAQAQKTDGGQLVVWDWYELSPAVIAKFHEKFPNIKISTKGLNYNLSAQIISAKATGTRNSDIVKGSITSITKMYDAGYYRKIDWTKYGVPKEFFSLGAPEMLPSSVNGPLLQYNTSKAATVPTSLDDYLKPEWKGKLAVANYNAQNFTGYGMADGKDKMVQLIKDLKAQGGMNVVNDTDPLLSNGDTPIAYGGQLFNPNPALKVVAPDTENMYVQFSGVNSDAKNPAAAILFDLWNAYDPDWNKAKLSDPDFATSAVPFPGLPQSTFDGASGLIKANMDAWFAAIDKPGTTFESMKNRDQYNSLIDAADAALSAK